jgi:plastocyanin
MTIVRLGVSRARAAAFTLIAAAALAGCGSSSTSSGTGTSATGTAAKTATNGSTSPSGSSLKVIQTPKFPRPPKSAPVHSGLVEVAYRNITISPVTLRVKAGTTVRWRNFDPVEHNVTSHAGPQRVASQNFGQGQSFEVKLTRKGLLRYECTIHPVTMNGSIEVL